jgi:hypothetical protein
VAWVTIAGSYNAAGSAMAAYPAGKVCRVVMITADAWRVLGDA